MLTKLTPHHDVSDIENRTLATAPVATRESLLSGDYFLAWETYFKDHVFLRGTMIKGNTWLNINVLDRAVVNDIVLTENRLLPYLTPSAAADTSARASAMGDRLKQLEQAVSAYGGTFLYIGVPTQMTVFADDYPDYLYNGLAERSASAALFSTALSERDIAFIDMADVFASHGGAQSYYMSTDHHYTLKGAFLVYQTLCARLNAMGYSIPVLTENDLFFSAVDVPFLGSRSRALYYLPRLSDEFYIFSLRENVAFTRTDNGKPVSASVLRLPQSLADGVSYNVYMGGDIAETVIQTNRPELPSILLFGDSFTNAVETFLYTSFDETRSLDLRHYTGMALTEYVRLYRPDIVVCLRDDANYLTETGNGDIR